MNCPKCGYTLHPDAKLCIHCGAPVDDEASRELDEAMAAAENLIHRFDPAEYAAEVVDTPEADAGDGAFDPHDKARLVITRVPHDTDASPDPEGIEPAGPIELSVDATERGDMPSPELELNATERESFDAPDLEVQASDKPDYDAPDLTVEASGKADDQPKLTLDAPQAAAFAFATAPEPEPEPKSEPEPEPVDDLVLVPTAIEVVESPKEAEKEPPLTDQGYYGAPSDSSVLGFGIAAAALASSFYFSLLGFIFGIIGASKAKKFYNQTGILTAKAKVGRILSRVGLWLGLVLSIFFLIYIVALVGMVSNNWY